MRCPKSRFPIQIIVFDELELIIIVSQGLTLLTASLVNDFRFLNFWKSPYQARDMVILPELVKILWWFPTLTRCSLPCRGATVLGHYSSPRALPSGGSRFLNFCKTPLQAWETSVWTQMSNFYQNWRNSTDGCPLWMAKARLPEVQLTWVLFLWLANAKLMIWGFWIFRKS